MKELDEHIRECINACLACVRDCTHCAASCTEEKNAYELSRCIQLNLECAAICNAAVQLMSLNGTFSESLCRLCADICRRCMQECDLHDAVKNCHESAASCRYCAALCIQLGGMPATP